MNPTIQSFMLAALCALGAVLMCIGIVTREKVYRKRQLCGICNDKEHIDWKWRHAIRWSIVCILLLQTFHQLRWTLLPQLSIYSDYVFPDIAMAIFGMIYAASLLVHPYGSAKEPEQYVDTGTH